MFEEVIQLLLKCYSKILGGHIYSYISESTVVREYGSVGLARAVSPTITNFRLTFLLTRLQEALYEDLAVYSIKFEVYHHFSGLLAEVNFWHP